MHKSRPRRRSWPQLLVVAGLLAAAVPALAAERLLVIGATSRSAAQIIPQALDRGYAVTALARRPEAVAFRHERLTVVPGDVYDTDSLVAAMQGDEVVISMVGPRVDPLKEVEFMDLYTVGTANIIAAMRKVGDQRLLVASSLAVENELPTQKPAGDDLGTMWIWNARRLYQDMAAMEAMVRDSGIDYVILRPPFLVEEPARNDLNIAVNEPSPKGTMATYADFARFVLDQVEANEYLNTTVGITTDRELQWGENADFEKLAEQAAKDREAAGAQ